MSPKPGDQRLKTMTTYDKALTGLSVCCGYGMQANS